MMNSNERDISDILHQVSNLDGINPDVLWKVTRRSLSMGLPPSRFANGFQIGLTKVLSRVTNELIELNELAEFEHGIVRFAEGDYSGGKTLLCNCISEIADQMGFATVTIDLIPGGASLDRLDRIYPHVARNIKFADATGLDQVILRAVALKFAPETEDPKQIDLKTLDPDEVRKVRAWIRETKSSCEVESRGFMMAALGLVESQIDVPEKTMKESLLGNEEKAEICRSILRGEQVSPLAASNAGVRERFSKETSRSYLRSLCQFLFRAKLTRGTLFCFDEARRMPQNKRAVLDVCNNLQSLIDETSCGRLPATFYMFSFLSDFFEEIVVRYPALQQRISQHARIKPSDEISMDALLDGMAEKYAKIFYAANPSCRKAPFKKAKPFFVKNVPIVADTTGFTRLMGATLVAFFDEVRMGAVSDDVENQTLMSFIKKEEGKLKQREKSEAERSETEPFQTV